MLNQSQLTLVLPSRWLCDEVAKSFLGHYRRVVVHNGIDLAVFRPDEGQIPQKKIILGVASVWDKLKGLDDFVRLAAMLRDDEEIVLVGLSERQIESLPKNAGLRGIRRTESQAQLAALYASAVAFVNPTYEDTFPTTNLEALACGTPVITYRTGGSPEALDDETGFVVQPGDVAAVRTCLDAVERAARKTLGQKCRGRAERLFAKDERFAEYMDVYDGILAGRS